MSARVKTKRLRHKIRIPRFVNAQRAKQVNHNQQTKQKLFPYNHPWRGSNFPTHLSKDVTVLTSLQENSKDVTVLTISSRSFFFLPCRARHDSSDGRSRLHTIRTQFKRNKRSHTWGKQPKQSNQTKNTNTNQTNQQQNNQPNHPQKLRSRR